MTLREQIIDVLGNSGPKMPTSLVRILENFDPKNKSQKGIHPVKVKILSMLNDQEIILTTDCYLKLP